MCVFTLAIFVCFATSKQSDVMQEATPQTLKLAINSISRACEICVDAACVTKVRARSQFVFLEINVSASFASTESVSEPVSFTFNAPENFPRETLTPFTNNPLFDALPSALNRSTTTAGRLVFEIANDRDILAYALIGRGSPSVGQVVLNTFTGIIAEKACATR